MRLLPTLLIPALLWCITATAAQKPNIIFVLVDDLGYGDVGVFFQNARKTSGTRAEPWHTTPNLDAMAADGIQLRHHYCPAPVCAPSRASLLLGVHQGHANVRDNQFDKALENNHTLGTVLQKAGYTTAAIGKWGLQGDAQGMPPNWPAHPMRRGFNYYFGYMRHNDGHFHYPKEDKREVWDGMTDISTQLDGCYTTDLFTARAKKWIVDQRRSNPEKPFFLYLAYDTPHAKLQLPPKAYPAGGGLKGGVQWTGMEGQVINTADGTPDSYMYPDYATATWDHDGNPATPEQAWPDVYKRYASDVRRIDDCIGDLLQTLRDLKIDRETLVVFTTDNGPSKESYLPQNYDPDFFNSFGPFDGIKRDVWEGGIRVGALAHWPAKIMSGRVSDEPSQFQDWMATFAEMAGVPAPARADGVSLVPTLTGAGVQKPSTIYVEYFEGGKTPSYDDFASEHRGRVRKQMQAIRVGQFIGVRYQVKNHADPFEIYDIVSDPKQVNNLATAKPELQTEMHNAVLRLRRPGANITRPYDDEPVPAISDAKTVPGLECLTFTETLPWVAKLDNTKPAARQTVADVNAVQLVPGTTAALIRGFVEIPAAGEYTFSLPAGSSALLRIHDSTVLDAGFVPAPQQVSSKIWLAAGKHPFRFYVQLDPAKPSVPPLSWSSESGPLLPLPSEILSRAAE